jgi:hypothetical protein
VLERDGPARGDGLELRGQRARRQQQQDEEDERTIQAADPVKVAGS